MKKHEKPPAPKPTPKRPQRKRMANEARLIDTTRLIGARRAAEVLGLERSTLTKRIHAGNLVPLVQLDGDGAYVFDLDDIEAIRDREKQ